MIRNVPDTRCVPMTAQFGAPGVDEPLVSADVATQARGWAEVPGLFIRRPAGE